MDDTCMTEVWKDFLNIVREEAGNRIVETWFKAIAFDRWDALQKVVYLIAPNAFVYHWVKKNYLSMIQLHLGRLLHIDMPRIEFVVHGVPKMIGTNGAERAVKVIPASVLATDGAPLQSLSKKFALCNPHYLFDNFVVGPSNSLAYAASRAVTEQPGLRYNPLFIYGKSGLGKTHLMCAIGNEIKARHKNATILYQTTDRFVNEFIGAIRFNKVHLFQERYHSVDVLLIDDMQFISHKEHTQEAFFHIFNALYESRKQIVFSSDAFPHDIDGIAERLRSRLTSGLVTDICEPSMETKIAILKKKSCTNGEQLSDDMAHFIASHGFSNIRELEGALVRITAFAALTRQQITEELVRKVLARASQRDAEKTVISFKKIVKGVEKHSSYTLEDLCSKNRAKELAEARHIAMFLMKKLTGKSLRDIGGFLGGRDHSTVMHGLQKIEGHIQHDSALFERVKKLENELVGT